MIIDLNIKLLENSIGEDLDDLGCGDNFLDTIPKAQSMEEIIDNWTSLK